MLVEECIRCVRWNEAGTLLVTGSDDCTVNVIDFNSKKILYKSQIDESDPSNLIFIDTSFIIFSKVGSGLSLFWTLERMD